MKPGNEPHAARALATPAIYSTLGNENSDADHFTCSRGPKVPHPWFTWRTREIMTLKKHCFTYLQPGVKPLQRSLHLSSCDFTLALASTFQRWVGVDVAAQLPITA